MIELLCLTLAELCDLCGAVDLVLVQDSPEWDSFSSAPLKLDGQSPFVRRRLAERPSLQCISIFASAPLLLLRAILCCQTMLLEFLLVLVYLLNQRLLV
jgi:hypothetical protein